MTEWSDDWSGARRPRARLINAYDPWADLASRTGVELTWHPPGNLHGWDSPSGLTTFAELSVSLLLGIDEVNLRCTLAHELVHLERGPVGLPWANKTVAGEEARVHLIAAQRLIAPEAYEEWLEQRREPTVHPEEARAFCGVDTVTLLTYRRWRKRVTDRTAARAHERAAEPVTWPPPWLAENSEKYATAARMAGLEADGGELSENEARLVAAAERPQATSTFEP